MSCILVTGSSGFIGYHTIKSLLSQGHTVIGIDNENDYYSPKLKEDRRSQLQMSKNFTFYNVGIEDFLSLEKIFENHKPERILHLAAQAGVRYSIENPFSYIQTNIVGFHNVIELAKRYTCKNFVYASSASVYGGNTDYPFQVDHKTEKPLSLYGATKKSNELIAYSYTNMFGLSTIGCRFFNVYGPWGRPDGAFFIFIKNILDNKEIDVFNYGESLRNFTYIDDIVNAVTKLIFKEDKYAIYNLGNTRQVKLLYMIECIEKSLGKIAKKNLLPLSIGDISESDVDIGLTNQAIGWEPHTNIEEGVENLVQRYLQYYT